MPTDPEITSVDPLTRFHNGGTGRHRAPEHPVDATSDELRWQPPDDDTLQFWNTMYDLGYQAGRAAALRLATAAAQYGANPASRIEGGRYIPPTSLADLDPWAQQP